MAMAACSTRQRPTEMNPNGANYFMEKFFLKIQEHFDKQDLIDVTFKLSNPSALVTAHRLILSVASPYFNQLFKSEAGICPVIEITNIDSETFESLIIYCYTGTTLITIDNVEQMLKAALSLQLEDAVTNCVDFLIENMTEFTLDRAYKLEHETQCALLSDKILEYELGNLMSVMQSHAFLNFDVTKLKTILESDDLNVPNEKVAFEAVKRWYEHDPSARKQQLPDIISCLRLTQFDTNFLLTDIQPLPGCHVVALEALSWINIPSSRKTLSLRFTNPRRQLSESVFLAFNIWGSDPKTMFQYNKNEDLWEKWIDIEMRVEFVRVIFMDDNLVFIGGRRNDIPINEVSSWNFKTKTFRQLPSMNQPRYAHCLVILNDKIYAIGGMGVDGKALNSVEVYSVSNGWKSINSMITSRCYVSAVVLNGKIHVIGGSNGCTGLQSVECYNPTTNCWTQCGDMNERHNNPGVAVHNGQIFVVGGFPQAISRTVERYDPQKNEWTKICSLTIGLELTECISIDNQLWAIGGCGTDCVSVYDEQNDKWIDKKPMPLKGKYYCFTAPKALLASEPEL